MDFSPASAPSASRLSKPNDLERSPNDRPNDLQHAFRAIKSGFLTTLRMETPKGLPAHFNPLFPPRSYKIRSGFIREWIFDVQPTSDASDFSIYPFLRSLLFPTAALNTALP